ncbi:hypothetical protein SAMN05421858_5078 [Haladaptatus litoreus]|uniref:Uncharacterized protein n=1 Tax=Haladaptatus litoreus TaxID=553468 RepID=A0A1N7FI57_9EURY|nr:hypothetical protein SAMN05421858_5078 [Haladaptatus litoreus]
MTITAFEHEHDLEEIDGYELEGVLYSPLKCSFLSPSHKETYPVVCKSCDWETTVGELPRDGRAYVQPPQCPACEKRGDLGFVRTKVTDAKPAHYGGGRK